jgi:hypothetical protein
LFGNKRDSEQAGKQGRRTICKASNAKLPDFSDFFVSFVPLWFMKTAL